MYGARDVAARSMHDLIVCSHLIYICMLFYILMDFTVHTHVHTHSYTHIF